VGNEMPDSVLHPEGRVRAWERLGSEQFDVVVIGGGVVGAGAALDAATRGLKVALVEARDFASGTSSRSSKMFHGGLRYLEQLEFGLVREALHERELSLTTLAPHLVKPLPFLFPLTKRLWERPYIAAGIMLLFLRPFQVGDFISTSSASGVVKEIGLFATEFETLDGLYLLAPNSEIWNSAVTNYSRKPKRRFDLVVGIAYDDDINKAFAAFQSIIDGHDKVLKDPEPFIYVSNLGDSSVEVTCRIWMNTSDWWTVSRELTKMAKERFDAEGLSIPFPQRDVHLYQAAA